MKAKVLIVEDDEAVLETLQLMLEGEFNVIVARNGAEAVNIFEFVKPDVVLMDIFLPEMDGVQATKEILKKDPNAIVIGITAYARRRGRDLIEAGARELLEKPFGRKLVIDTIQKYLKDQNR